MPDYVRMSRNFVNLGRLYSIAPWGLPKPPQNSVNLGNFYAETRYKTPTGWGYFEDGSVFINAKTYLEHDAFEAEMKLLFPFVRGPSPNLDRVRREDPEQQRLIVIAKARPIQTAYRVLARNARDGQRIVVEKTPFENITFQLDETGSFPVSAKFDRSPKLPSFEHRRALLRAMHSFRGTLIDGVLQPNVRLGNGLALSTSSRLTRTANPDFGKDSEESIRKRLPHKNKTSTKGTELRRKRGGPGESDRRMKSSPMQKNRRGEDTLSRREAELKRREQQLLLLQQQLLMQSVRSTPRRRQDLHFRERQLDDADRKAAKVEAKERELRQREEILLWKHRNFVLQQKLAMSRGQDFPQPQYADDALLAQEEYTAFPSEEALEGPDPFAEFDVHNPVPPGSLANLRTRTRITLPRRKRI